MLSRAVVVVRGSTLIVNLPGSEKGVRESLAAILEVLPHAVELLQGQTEHP
jgi:molybdopterin biosynthesis enzyme MoaB